MKVRTVFVEFVLAVLLCVPLAQAVGYNLQELIDTQGTVVSGDKIMGEFGILTREGYIAASSITVSPIGTQAEGPDYYGITFGGGGLYAQGGAILDFAIHYSVTVAQGSGYKLHDISQAFNLFTSGGGSVTIGETVFADGFGQGPVLAQSSLFWPPPDMSDPAAEGVQGDDLIFAPCDKVYVTKDIRLESPVWAIDPETGEQYPGRIGTTIIYQRFSQVPVPDGGKTLVMLLGGLISSLALRRRFA